MAQVKKKCEICGRIFTPDKYHPHQKVCYRPSCQHKRQLKNLRQWRKRNPDYFNRTEYELEVKREGSKRWREKHPDYYKMYYQKENNKEGNSNLGELSILE